MKKLSPETIDILKSEFPQFENEINQILFFVNGWISNNSLLKRPLILNLWGRTGVGKTKLVQRIIDLIGCKRSYIDLNMNILFREGYQRFSDLLKIQLEHRKDRPTVILIDDFLSYVTKPVNLNNQDNKDRACGLWELIDKGKIEINLDDYDFELTDTELFTLTRAFKSLVKGGLTAEMGKITNVGSYQMKDNPWQSPFDIDDTNNKNHKLLSEQLIAEILAHPRLSYTLEELNWKVEIMNQDEFLEFLESIIESITRPKVISLTNALIVLCHNPDEHLKHANEAIDQTTIQQILAASYRKQEASRLGRNHIVLQEPSLNYMKVMAKQFLEDYTAAIKEETLVNLNIDIDSFLGFLKRTTGLDSPRSLQQMLTAILNLNKDQIINHLKSDSSFKHLTLKIQNNCLELIDELDKTAVLNVRLPIYPENQITEKSSIESLQANTLQ